MLTNIKKDEIIRLGVVENYTSGITRIYKSYTDYCKQNIVISYLLIDGSLRNTYEGNIRKKIISNSNDIYYIAIRNSHNKSEIDEFKLYFPSWKKIMNIVLAKKKALYSKLQRGIDNPPVMNIMLNIIKRRHDDKKILIDDVENIFNLDVYDELIYFILFYKTSSNKRIV
jgi:hypothetical protein